MGLHLSMKRWVNNQCLVFKATSVIQCVSNFGTVTCFYELGNRSNNRKLCRYKLKVKNNYPLGGSMYVCSDVLACRSAMLCVPFLCFLFSQAATISQRGMNYAARVVL